MNYEYDMLDFIKSRRSTRKFKNEMIMKEQLDKIIEAGRYAPSGNNSQSTHFIVIENREILNKLVKLVKTEFAKMEVSDKTNKSMLNSISASKNGNYVFHYNCPVLVVVANKKDYGNNIADCACALENMMLMANALDLGSVWINQLRWLNENEVLFKTMRDIGLESDERVYGALAIGYADLDKGLPPRTPLERTGNKVTYVR